MEKYYLPSSVDIEVADQFFITTNGDTYLLADKCPSSSNSPYTYTKIGSDGRVIDIGSSNYSSNNFYIVGTGCSTPNVSISAELSTSIFSNKLYSPYEFIYNSIVLLLSTYLIIFGLKLFFGHGYK